MAVVSDTRLAQSVEAMLAEDLRRCVLLDKDLGEQPVAIRVGAPLARLLAPVL